MSAMSGNSSLACTAVKATMVPAVSGSSEPFVMQQAGDQIDDRGDRRHDDGDEAKETLAGHRLAAPAGR